MPLGHDKNKRGAEMLYSDGGPVGDRVKVSSDTNPLFEYTIPFPVDREAGEVVTLYPF